MNNVKELIEDLKEISENENMSLEYPDTNQQQEREP